MYEKAVEFALTSGVKRRGGMAVKAERLGKGWPDRLVLFRGSCAWVELKRPGGSLRRRQKAIAGMLRRNGFYVVCLHSIDEVDEWLRSWFGD